MTGTANISADFIAVAERALNRWDQEREAALQKKFGALYEEYKRELAPIVTAISKLPAQAGCVFTVGLPAAGDNHLCFVISCITPASEGPYTRKYYVWDDNGKEIVIDKNHHYNQKPSNFNRHEVKTFAEVRSNLAHWFASVAPERVAELKNILMPEENVTLKRSMQAASAIRLKTAEAAP